MVSMVTGQKLFSILIKKNMVLFRMDYAQKDVHIRNVSYLIEKCANVCSCKERISTNNFALII
jgi:hypothetical protein